jgi:hypothetical protein
MPVYNPLQTPAAAAAGPGSQLDSLLADMRPATETARSKLQQQQQQQQQIVPGRAAGAGSGRIMPSSSSGRLQRSSIALSYEADGAAGGRSGGVLGLSRSAAAPQAAAAAAAEHEIIGPAHLVQKHKLKQQLAAVAGDGSSEAAAADAQQQQQQQQGKSKQPLRMGQFLKTWNSTQIEQQKQQQAQELEQQQQQLALVEKQKQQQHRQQQQDQQARDHHHQQQQQQEETAAAAAAAPAMDPKSFFKLLHEQLQPQQMAAVKALLTAYK